MASGGGQKPRLSTLIVLALIASFLTLCALIIPNFLRARTAGRIMACKSNFKHIGTACEMYFTDHGDEYPGRLEQLLPKYLKTLPECPAAGTVTYKLETGLDAGYNTVGFEDYYFIYCQGNQHEMIGLPPNYPQYDGIRGLIER